MIPTDLRTEIEKNAGITIRRAINISGGSINEAAKLILDDDSEVFLKWNSSHLFDMFRTEVEGLDLLRKHALDIVIPEIITVDSSEQHSWLLLEYIHQGRRDGSFFEIFGSALAQLHRNEAAQFGLETDNYIGRLPQRNTQEAGWITFFIESRLEPQVKKAVDTGYLPSSITEKFEKLYQKLPDMIPDEKPALLHGDLWNGNFLASHNQQPVLIDPAVYYGHREAELAFTKLFGGFSSSFYTSYAETYPLTAGFEQRVDFFNLYPLLVHVNLFGHAYTSQVTSIINRI